MFVFTIICIWYWVKKWWIIWIVCVQRPDYSWVLQTIFWADHHHCCLEPSPAQTFAKYIDSGLREGNKTLPIKFKYLYNSAVVRETSASHPNIWDLLGHVCGKLKRLSGILEYKYGHVCPILGDFYIMCTIDSSVSKELVRHLTFNVEYSSEHYLYIKLWPWFSRKTLIFNFSFLSNAKTACLLSY